MNFKLIYGRVCLQIPSVKMGFGSQAYFFGILLEFQLATKTLS